MPETPIKPGRELDITICELKLGQPRFTCRTDPMNRNGEPQFHYGYPVGHDFAPEYSTDNMIALNELEEIPCLLSSSLYQTPNQQWVCSIIRDDGNTRHRFTSLPYTTKALAICHVLVSCYKRYGKKPLNERVMDITSETHDSL